MLRSGMKTGPLCRRARQILHCSQYDPRALGQQYYLFGNGQGIGKKKKYHMQTVARFVAAISHSFTTIPRDLARYGTRLYGEMQRMEGNNFIMDWPHLWPEDGKKERKRKETGKNGRWMKTRSRRGGKLIIFWAPEALLVHF